MDSKPHRRRFRFSVRTLLIAVAIVSVWFGWRVKRVREVDQAVRAIKAKYGEVGIAVWTPQSPVRLNRHLLRLRPTWQRIVFGEGDDEWFVAFGTPNTEPIPDLELIALMPHLANMPNLTTLFIRGPVTNRGVESIGRLRNLSYLDAGFNAIDDGAVDSFTPLNRLKELRLYKTSVTRDGVERLEQALPQCDVRSSVK